MSVAADTSGNLFFAVQDTVLRLDATTGLLSLVAGNGTESFSGDNGPATSAQLASPGGVAIDTSGNLYILDTLNYRIRKVSNEVITTVAGNGTAGFGGDNGPATSAELSYPAGVAVDSAGNLYIADTYNHRIRKVSSGVITTVAGNGTDGFSGDNGAATSAELANPDCIAVDSSGNVYFADYGNSRVRRVSGGVITTVAGGGLSLGDGGDRIRKVSNGVITTVAGTGTAGFSGDKGPAASAQLSLPSGLGMDSAGNLYVADYGNSSIRRISVGVITTVAGSGTFSGDAGASMECRLASAVAQSTGRNLSDMIR